MTSVKFNPDKNRTKNVSQTTFVRDARELRLLGLLDAILGRGETADAPDEIDLTPRTEILGQRHLTDGARHRKGHWRFEASVIDFERAAHVDRHVVVAHIDAGLLRENFEYETRAVRGEAAHGNPGRMIELAVVAHSDTRGQRLHLDEHGRDAWPRGGALPAVIVPPTVMRDGPFGQGMCQLWIDLDPEVDLVALSRRSDHAGLREMAVFDAVVNNADRKIGHLLPVTDGHLYGCDHGVCFAEDYKLRTVLWQWRGKALPRRSVEVLRRLADDMAAGWLADELSKHLTRSEINAARSRVAKLLKHRTYPYPSEDWPAIPWPPV